ncbi:hypothetical protein [Limnoglobus roseus]|uniref:Uncharacterized protein n=1 Tax=Limnoglobus roseus TaxID=2598579 RepID=A0A5C1AAL2_9BACT|nr:hypothetical protein [Limnoglobus roseus]QEL15770.1 hypothetical protein PX52LOC_02706 [Limnoglobus roseus]
MITIRPEQYETFEKKAHQDFEDELVAHLKQFSPKHAAGVGDEGLRKLIRTGLRNARHYGFKCRGSLRFYVECQVMFGHEFHADPLLPWAGREFGKKGWGDELARADAIHAVAMEYRKAVVGEKDAIELAAIRRLVKKPPVEWVGGDPSDATTRQILGDLYPEKIAQAPPDAVSAVVARGKQAAATNQLPAVGGGRVMAGLMVAFGHGVLADPQFPWIMANLAQTRGQSPEDRLKSLGLRTLAYLSDGLASVERE